MQGYKDNVYYNISFALANIVGRLDVFFVFPIFFSSTKDAMKSPFWNKKYFDFALINPLENFQICKKNNSTSKVAW